LEDKSLSSVSHSSIHIPTPQHETKEQEMEEGANETLQEEETKWRWHKYGKAILAKEV
jgi:hypothetical protein